MLFIWKNKGKVLTLIGFGCVVFLILGPGRSAFCHRFGSFASGICPQPVEEELAPITTEVIWERFDAVAPQALVAKWEGEPCTYATTAKAVGEIDDFDTVSLITTGIEVVKDVGHNLLQSEELKICVKMEVPIYVDLAWVDIRQINSGHFAIDLPDPTYGAPAAISKHKVTVNSKVFAESEARREQIIENSLAALSEQARIEVRQDSTAKHAALCQGYQQLAAALVDLPQATYVFLHDGVALECMSE